MRGRGHSQCAAIAAAGLVTLLACRAASAAACRGVEFPASIEADGTMLDLNGLGVRKATFLRISVYVAALYLPRGAARPATDARSIIHSAGPWKLVLHFVRGVSARQIRDAFSDAFASEGGGRLPASLAPRVAMLNRWMPEMRAGEAMSFRRIPGRGVEVAVGGRPAGVIAGDDFAEALLAVWLGAHPPNAELKAGLLGGACG